MAETFAAPHVVPGVTVQDSSVEYPARGKHLLLTLSGCRVEQLNDEGLMRELANRAATATGATVLQTVCQQFSPQGVTALVLLAESHASLHTYPESGVLFWDCFTCGDRCDPFLSVEVLVKALNPAETHIQTVLRK